MTICKTRGLRATFAAIGLLPALITAALALTKSTLASLGSVSGRKSSHHGFCF
jgi:hypothetical protein